MKKIILSCLILCGTLTFAQTTTPTTTTQAQTVVSKTDTTLESVARNIDRRLVYFNRYKQSEDMESLSKLISEENKDFYINFMKYMKAAPIFTLKRDLKGRIIKTPTDEYVFPVVMTVDGKENKVSVTFIEEKKEQGSKWLIYTSNIHIQALPPKTNTNLGSSVVTTPTTPSTTPKKTITPPKDTNIGSSVVIDESKTNPSLPVVKNTTPTPLESNPEKKASSAGLDMVTIIFIAIASIVIVGSIGGYYIFSKRGKAKKILAASALTASAAILSEVSNPVETPTSAAPSISPSNVIVSTVEEIHTTVPAPVVMSDISNDSLETNRSGNTSEEIPSEKSNFPQDSTLPSIEQTPIQELSNENITGLFTEPAQEFSLDQEKILEIASRPDVFIAETSEPIVPVETSISPAEHSEPIVQNIDTPDVSVTPPAPDMPPHALFDGIFDTVPVEENTQNALNPKK